MVKEPETALEELTKALELAKAMQREYMKEWRKKNKDKVRIYQQRYWLKKALENQKS